MPERVIVTLSCKGQQADFELSARVPLKRMEEPLRQALRASFPQLSLRGYGIALRTPEGLLSPEYTLEEYGVFDGSILQVELSPKAQ